MKLALLIPLILITGMLAGCASPECGTSTTNFGVRYTNESSQDLSLYFQFPTGSSGDHYMRANGGGGTIAGFSCKGRLDAVPDPFWMHIELREKEGTQPVGGQLRGPVIFEGNWTGLECGGRHVFQYFSSDHVEAFEVDSFGGCGKNPEKKVRDLERVPP